MCLAVLFLLTVSSCSSDDKADNTDVPTPTDNEIVHIVAVVAPIGDAATKTRLERTAQWFAENHRKAQQGDSVVIRFQLEWYDELSEDLTALSTRLAGRNDVVAVVGPFGNEAVNAFASACLKKNKALIAPTATRGDEIVSLGDYNGQGISCFTLNNRTLYKDGSWNTLCLPFGYVIDNDLLYGAEARTLISSSFTNGTLTLTFSDPVSELQAGVPYIIKWDEDSEIENPVFTMYSPSPSTQPSRPPPPTTLISWAATTP